MLVVPAGQLVQEAAPPPLYVPAAHEEQETALPPPLYVPAAHEKQLLPDLYVPAEQDTLQYVAHEPEPVHDKHWYARDPE